MREDLSILGIIPARGGSRRLPGKNIRKLLGMSLLERTIRQAKQALPDCIVSTEDTKIMAEARRCGISVLERPAWLATADAPSGGLVRHALNANPGFEWFCLLQVTSPLRTAEDIACCIELAVATGRPVVSTACGKPNGAVYIGKSLAFSGDFTKGAIAYEMPLARSVDIDTLDDWNEAERRLLELNENKIRTA